MLLDLLAGTRHAPCPAAIRPTILVFDSGLGGLTVFSEVVARCPQAEFVYAADDAAFPVGTMPADILARRVLDVMHVLVTRHRPDLVVVACNTISTLVMPQLRARYPMPFVGTVPAIKPAAEGSRSGLIAVLATPGTIARDYTRELVGAYAARCRVTLVGATRLAAYAEAEMAGTPVSDEAIRREISPCFVTAGNARTDTVVLACTHYPLLLDRLRRLAPWPVTWIDPAPAIARRAADLLGGPAPAIGRPRPASHAKAVFTGGAGLTSALRGALGARGLRDIEVCRMPLAGDGLPLAHSA